LISLLPAEDVLADAKVPPGGPADAARETDAPVEPGSEWLLGTSGSDSIGTNDGKLMGGASFGTDATRAGFLVCNGTDAAVRVVNEATNNFTFTAWIWSDVPSSKGSSPLDGDALIWSNVSGKNDDFAFVVLSDHLSYINYNQTSTGAGSVTDRKWHQVAVTRHDGARVQLYVDGVLDGDGNSGSGPVLANPYVFFCGVDTNGGHFFHGRMSDVRFYPRVLSAAEVEAAFVAQK
jgi:hypothetical protein